MNSFLAAALRWIFPLAARGATVDFFGTDAEDFFETEDFEDEVFVELFLGFDDRALVEEERLPARDEEPRLF